MIKVLLITYYWPPAGGGGVQRWLKMSKYLPDQGVDLTVYTPEDGEFPGYDPSLVEEVDPRIKILKQPIWEPYHLFKKFTGKSLTVIMPLSPKAKIKLEARSGCFS
ncbi:MAG: hypothetical protein IPH36_19215 [Saprospiraceae bacterium]|nr:hypothetical protein [Saprospiraceae bacterium]